MTIDHALFLDQRSKTGVTEDLQRILDKLQDFKSKNPQVFQYLYNEAIATGDMSLGDAEAALLSAIREVGSDV
jgi:hypothetical protein